MHWRLALSSSFLALLFVAIQNFAVAQAQWETYELTVDDQTFRIPYKIMDASLGNIEADLDSLGTSLMISVEDAGDDGMIEITVPKNLINAIHLIDNAWVDEPFIVLADGEELKSDEEVRELVNSQCFRTLAIEIPSGSEEIEIIAARVEQTPWTLVPPVYVTTDKNNYQSGETIGVSGCTDLTLDDEQVVLEVLDPKGEVYRTISLTTNMDGSFSTSLVVEAEQALEGTYTAKATYAGESATNAFIVPEFPIAIMVASVAIGLMLAFMRLKSFRLFLQ